VDYEAIQHIPAASRRLGALAAGEGRDHLRERRRGDSLLHAAGPRGESSLRGFASWRFRDRHSLLLQAEWRVLVNNFIDTAIFYDAGKVTDSQSDLDLDGLKSDFGIGFRLHGPAATPLRIELAKSNEGLVIVFSAHARSEELDHDTTSFPGLPIDPAPPDGDPFRSGLLVAALAIVQSAGPTFLSDDPITREPETADASAHSRGTSTSSTT